VSEPEDRLLDAARAGDEDAFRRIVEPLERQLVAHCYRMLGSLHDAEDAVQETLLRAWRGLPRFEGRSSVRAWLHRIATNVALDMAARRPKRVLPPDPGPPEAAWIEPFPDELLGDDTGLASPEAVYEQREAIELAFVAALQHLPPKQRAALLLSDVVECSAAEIAELLGLSVASVNSAIQRARATLAQRGVAPESSEGAVLTAAQSAMVSRFVEAFERYDVDTLASLCRDDVTFSMPPFSLWLSGREPVRAWLLGRGAGCRGSRLVPLAANGSPAFAQYKPAPAGGYRAWGISVLELDGERVLRWNTFLDVERLFPKFGLPLDLPA
jgi:RNA polymerase sigma-70 factor (ECF subfamily)